MNTDSRTQAIILLTIPFKGDKANSKTLNINEYNKVSELLKAHNAVPEDLLENKFLRFFLNEINKSDIIKNTDRIESLMRRKTSLALAMDKWSKASIYILNRQNEDYPKKIKNKLKRMSPPILFIAGSKNNLMKSNIAVVGSRKIDDNDILFTKSLGKKVAELGYSVVSGCAKGVDEIAMTSTLDAEGIALGVAANNLLQLTTSQIYRDSIINKNLTLLSPYNPEAGFHVGNAMGRNKIIYCLSEFAVIVNCTLNKGGTWTGAVENIKKEWVPILVNHNSSDKEGNMELTNRGAQLFPETLDDKFIKSLTSKEKIKKKDNNTKKNNKKQMKLF